jgi:serine/threonine protein kinase
VNLKTNVEYACKIFPKEQLANDGDQSRFQREIDIMAFLKHDNMVALHDFFWDDENFYLILDFCSGGELFDYIAEHDRLDEPTAALVFQQIVSAVAYCHSFGVAHRDLKPENVLILDFPHIKVADFGLCGFISEQTMMRTFCGSPCYCSPECLCRIEYDGRKSDIWSLGVILFTMVTGEHPWNVTNTSIMLRQILKGTYTVPGFVSPDCKNLICSMMRVTPSERLSMERILEHPWLKLADSVTRKLAFRPPELVMPVQPVSLKELSGASSASSQTSDSGIHSPFEDNGNAQDQGGMPMLLIRSQSLDHVTRGGHAVPRWSASGRRKIQGLSLANARQRSATNVRAVDAASAKPGPGNPRMNTIGEDDGR